MVSWVKIKDGTISRTLIKRLVNRGWNDNAGKLWKGEESRIRARKLVNRFQRMVAEFNSRRGEGK